MDRDQAARAARVCALALWVGCAVAILTAILVLGGERGGGDRVRAWEVVSMVTASGACAKLVLALAALTAQAVLFYSRSSDADKGWRRHVPALLIMAALGAAVAGMAWQDPRIVIAYARLGTRGAAAETRLAMPLAGIALLGVEAAAVAAALIVSLAGGKAKSLNIEH